ncbi:hypothetical protein [Parasphingorhabdus cellanae]|uniref:Uncharacterized protein n=1 Tax=Parasphingorhabdus cellanae TaxID=2806553 RepID=A0ABX7T474_9SPHN|nr:hypothetical protein [Parasphingorhabdus cellanae]QTD56378.1 hypothetical protein J4G78_01890 [Parasphingorhabdus cellanae]
MIEGKNNFVEPSCSLMVSRTRAKRFHFPQNKFTSVVDFCTAADMNNSHGKCLKPRATTTYAPLGVAVLLLDAAAPSKGLFFPEN